MANIRKHNRLVSSSLALDGAEKQSISPKESLPPTRTPTVYADRPWWSPPPTAASNPPGGIGTPTRTPTVYADRPWWSPPPTAASNPPGGIGTLTPTESSASSDPPGGIGEMDQQQILEMLGAPGQAETDPVVVDPVEAVETPGGIGEMDQQQILEMLGAPRPSVTDPVPSVTDPVVVDPVEAVETPGGIGEMDQQQFQWLIGAPGQAETPPPTARGAGSRRDSPLGTGQGQAEPGSGADPEGSVVPTSQLFPTPPPGDASYDFLGDVTDADPEDSVAPADDLKDQVTQQAELETLLLTSSGDLQGIQSGDVTDADPEKSVAPADDLKDQVTQQAELERFSQAVGIFRGQSRDRRGPREKRRCLQGPGKRRRPPGDFATTTTDAIRGQSGDARRHASCRLRIREQIPPPATRRKQVQR